MYETHKRVTNGIFFVIFFTPSRLFLQCLDLMLQIFDLLFQCIDLGYFIVVGHHFVAKLVLCVFLNTFNRFVDPDFHFFTFVCTFVLDDFSNWGMLPFLVVGGRGSGGGGGGGGGGGEGR